MCRFLSHLKHLYSRALSDIKCSAYTSHFISDKALLRLLQIVHHCQERNTFTTASRRQPWLG